MNAVMEWRKEILISWSRKEYIILPNDKVLLRLISYYWVKRTKSTPTQLLQTIDRLNSRLWQCKSTAITCFNTVITVTSKYATLPLMRTEKTPAEFSASSRGLWSAHPRLACSQWSRHCVTGNMGGSFNAVWLSAPGWELYSSARR